MKQWFHREGFVRKIVQSSQIKEIALNPLYYTEDRLIHFIVQGFKVRWMTEDESVGKNIFILIVEE